MLFALSPFEFGLLIGIIAGGAITFIKPISQISGDVDNLNNNLPYLIETHTPVSRTSAGRLQSDDERS